MELGHDCDDIMRNLLDLAVSQFGESRSEQLKKDLERTAFQIWQMDQAVPYSELEPGFYQ